jgi:hypothetical protein
MVQQHLPGDEPADPVGELIWAVQYGSDTSQNRNRVLNATTSWRHYTIRTW